MTPSGIPGDIAPNNKAAAQITDAADPRLISHPSPLVASSTMQPTRTPSMRHAPRLVATTVASIPAPVHEALRRPELTRDLAPASPL